MDNTLFARIDELMQKEDWEALHEMGMEQLANEELDATAALACFLTAARGGFVDSMAALSMLYIQLRDALPPDDRLVEEVLNCTKTGADLGDSLCMVNYGLMLWEGVGGAPNRDEGKAYLVKAAEQDDAIACKILGILSHQSEDYSAAVTWLRKGADLGNEECLDYLATMYYAGQGVPQDVAECERIRQERAENSDQHHKFNLGWMYSNGEGVPQDQAKATYWYERAAAEGSAMAMFNLGHDAAHASPPDYEKAISWFEKSAECGHRLAMCNAASFYANGQGSPVDYAKAMHWYGRAIEAGDPMAMMSMGMMYLLGQGVEADTKQAFHYYKMAAENGHPDAMLEVSKMYLRGIGVDRDMDAACHWERLAKMAEFDWGQNYRLEE